MLTGLITGGIGSIIANTVNKGIDLYKDSQDRKHELEILKIQADLQREGHSQKMEAIGLEGEYKSEQAFYETIKEVRKPTGIKWIDGLNAFINPLLVLYFLPFYAILKYSMYHVALDSGLATYQAIIHALWTSWDAEIWASVIGFFVVKRFIGKK